jgi:NUDIX domain
MNGKSLNFIFITMIKLKDILLINEIVAPTPFAVFAVVRVDGGFAATTRPTDRGESGRIGLPGGKVDQGENAISALKRECEEEGWKIYNINPTVFHEELIDDKTIQWFTAKSAIKLDNYKEKGRITPIVATREQILNSGFRNGNLKI